MGMMVSPSLFAVTGGVDEVNLVTDFGGSFGAWIAYQGDGVNRTGRARDFSSRVWTTNNATAAINATTAPDGSVTACTLTETVSGVGSHNIVQSYSKNNESLTYTWTVYAKAKERTRICLAFERSASAFVGFDLVSGQVAYTGTTGTGFTIINASINDDDYPGTGWWRCRVTASTDTAGTVRLRAELDSGTGLAAAGRSYSGNGTSGVYLWGAKASYGSSLTPYLNSPYDDGSGATYTLFIPAGTYTGVGQIAKSYPGCVIYGEGVDVTIIEGQINFGGGGYPGESGTGNSTAGVGPTAPRVATFGAGATSVTLLDPANRLRNFYVDQPVMLCAYDMQGYGQPINTNFIEYNRITAIDVDTGVIDLETPVVYDGYKSTYPNNSVGNNFEPDMCGPAVMHDLPHSWDMDLIIRDLTINAPELIQGSFLRSLLCERVNFPDGSICPSQMQSYIMRDCVINGGTEIDKLTDLVWYDNCTVSGGNITCQSSSINTIRVTDCPFFQVLLGTPKFAELSNTTFNTLYLGPTSYGCGVSATLDNVHVNNNISGAGRNAAYSALTWAFDTAAQTLTIPTANATGSNALISLIPGGYFVPIMTGGFACGPVFKVTDVTEIGSNFVYDIEIPHPCPHITSIPWDRIYVHPCPSLTVTNTTTGAFAEQNFAAAVGRPLGAAYRKTVTPAAFIPGDPLINFVPATKHYGYLEELRVNVTTAYTGVRATLIFNPFTGLLGIGGGVKTVHANGTVDSTTLKVSINLKQTGERVITLGGGITGLKPGDLITNTTIAGDWIAPAGSRISGDISGESSSVYPVFTVQALLNHGI